jgi:hypothetical protein
MRKVTKEYKIFDYDVDKSKIVEHDWYNNEEKRKYMTNLASEIGWIIIEFSSLENKLDSILNFHLIETSKNKEIIYSLIENKRFSDKIDLFAQLLKINFIKNPEIYNREINNFQVELDLLINKLKDISQIRNKYAHSVWSNISESKYVESKTKISKNGIEKIYMKYDFEDIDKDYDDLFETGTILSKFNEKILNCLTYI